MMRYLPFIIISMVLYTLFFYKNQEPEILTLQTAPEKVIPLNFKKLAEQEQKSKREFPSASIAPEVSDPLSENIPSLEPIQVATSINSEQRVLSSSPETETVSAVVTTINTEIAKPLSRESEILQENSDAVATTSEVAPLPQPSIQIGDAKQTTQAATKPETLTSVSVDNPPLKIEAVKPIPIEEKTAQQAEATTSSEDSATSAHDKKQLLASIKATQASETAMLKAEYYEQDFHLELPAPTRKQVLKAKQESAVKSKTVTSNSNTEAKKITKSQNKPSLDKQIIDKKTSDNKIADKKAPDAQIIAKPVAAQESAITDLLQQTQSAPTASSNDITTSKQSSKPKRVFKKQVKAIEVSNEGSLQQAIAVSGNKPLYPDEAKLAKQQGVVTVKFIVNMKGKTKQPQLISSSGHPILDQSVLEFIKEERFMPALEGREKVTREQQFSFKFSL